MSNSLSIAMNFGFDFQEKSHGAPDHVEVIKETLTEYKEKIVKDKSEGNTIYFIDHSKATWVGNGWNIDESLMKEAQASKE